jgi:hypothetical protein
LVPKSMFTYPTAVALTSVMFGSIFYIGNQVGRLFAKSIQGEGSIRD